MARAKAYPTFKKLVKPARVKGNLGSSMFSVPKIKIPKLKKYVGFH